MSCGLNLQVKCGEFDSIEATHTFLEVEVKYAIFIEKILYVLADIP